MITTSELAALAAKQEAEARRIRAEDEARDAAKERAFYERNNGPDRTYRVRHRLQRSDWGDWSEHSEKFESRAIKAHLAEIYGEWVLRAERREIAGHFVAYVRGDSATPAMVVECVEA